MGRKSVTLLNNRRGSFTVFIVMAFAAVLILVFAVLAATQELAVSGVTDIFGRMWGRSLLAEYDINLKDRYGIFAFSSGKAEAEEKLDFYAGYSFGDKGYIRYGGAECRMEGYSLEDPKRAKEQISDAVRFGSKPKVFADSSENDETYGSRKITSQWILSALPSKNRESASMIEQLVDSIKNGVTFDTLVGSAEVNKYVFTYFKDNQNERDLGKTYFQNEIEYIISGKANDRTALRNVKGQLILMRNLLNVAYLSGSREKKEVAMALATVIAPGPLAVVVQKALMEVWALAEAYNDMKILTAGEKVPLLKKDENWALSLQNAAGSLIKKLTGGDGDDDGEEGLTVEDIEQALKEATDEYNDGNSGEDTGDGGHTSYVKPEVIEGIAYDDYLKILLNTVAEDTRVLRALDLIQINMKYLYCDYFLLSDYYTGLSFSLEVNGVQHEFEEVY